MMSKYSCFLSLLLAFALAGCDSPNAVQLTSGDPPVSQGGGAVARLQFKLGPVGVVAARSMARTAYRVVIRFDEIDTDGSVYESVRNDTLVIPSIGEISKEYRFEPGSRWVVFANMLDEAGRMLYSGSTEFEVEPNRSVDVPLTLDAYFSRGRIRVPVVDSMTRFVLKIDGETKVDLSVAKQTRVGEVLEFEIDRIPAAPAGKSNLFDVLIEGEMWGRRVAMYRLQKDIEVVSGESKGLQLGLAWVGPIDPPGAGAKLLMEFGTPGNLGIDLQLEDTTGVRGSDGKTIDPRTGEVYRYRVFGDRAWMLRNIGPERCIEGSYGFERSDRCDGAGLFLDMSSEQEGGMWGREDFHNACPTGWHVPDTSEWSALVRFAANGESNSVGVYRLRSVVGWDYDEPGESSPFDWRASVFNGSDELGFGLFPTVSITPDYSGQSYTEAEMFTSTPGCRLVRFTTGGFSSCADFWSNLMYSSNPNAAAVRCIKDVD